MLASMRLGLVSVSLLALAGCSGAVLVGDSPGPRHDYFDGDFEYATRDGAIVTDIAGNPFGMPKAQFDESVRRRMDGQTDGKDVRFVAGPQEGGVDARYRIVVAFNAAPTVSGFELCEAGGGGVPTLGTGTNVTMSMAFCIGDSLKAYMSGVAYGVADARAPQFDRLVRDVTHALIPPQDGEDSGDGNVAP